MRPATRHPRLAPTVSLEPAPTHQTHGGSQSAVRAAEGCEGVLAPGWSPTDLARRQQIIDGYPVE